MILQNDSYSNGYYQNNTAIEEKFKMILFVLGQQILATLNLLRNPFKSFQLNTNLPCQFHEFGHQFL